MNGITSLLVLVLFGCIATSLALDMQRINRLRAEPTARVKTINKIVAWNRVYGRR